MKLTPVFYSPYMTNAVAMYHDGRMFLGFPKWLGSVSAPFTIGVVINGELSEYKVASEVVKDPNALQIVDGILYIVDKTSIVTIDLKTNTLQKIFVIPTSKRLNDCRVEGIYAFITDSDKGSIFTLNLVTNSITEYNDKRFTLAEYKSIIIDGEKFTKTVNADGIGITYDKKFLIFTKPFGGHVYRIATEELIAGKVTRVDGLGEIGPHGGIKMMPDGSMLWTDVIHHQIMKRTKYYIPQDVVLCFGYQLQWADAMDYYKGSIYFPVAKVNQKKPQPPFTIYKMS